MLGPDDNGVLDGFVDMINYIELWVCVARQCKFLQPFTRMFQNENKNTKRRAMEMAKRQTII